MPVDLARVRALCFDIDGTLCDTDEQWVLRFERMMRPLRPLFRDGDVRPFVRWLVMSLETPGNLIYHLLDRFGLDDEIARVYNLLSRHWFGVRPRHFLLIPGVDELLHRLHGHYPMAVVSARDRHTTLAFLEYFNLLPYFSTIITSQSCDYTKPYPHPVQLAAQHMGVEAHECLMIGDTTVDIRCGKAAGAQTVGVLCGFGQEDELNRAGADIILPSTADLLLEVALRAHPVRSTAGATQLVVS
jgi:HAD superfamily hydrolase (TIGR01509 family)